MYGGAGLYPSQFLGQGTPKSDDKDIEFVGDLALQIGDFLKRRGATELRAEFDDDDLHMMVTVVVESITDRTHDATRPAAEAV